MSSTIPPELTSILADEIPIMHQCLLRLASYHYQNDPEGLPTHDVLRTAVILLNDSLEDIDLVYFGTRERAIFFQSMASLDRAKICKKDRDEYNDENLTDVLDGPYIPITI